MEGFVTGVFEASAAVKAQAGTALAPAIVRAAELIAASYRKGGILYTCGNGGSAADAQHLAGEMVGRYKRDRPPLAAVSLSTDPSTITCIANDYGYDEIFSRQVAALATARDVVLGISTSGQSKNVLLAMQAARARGAGTVGLTGGTGGELARSVDVAIIVPHTYTPRIQECHLTTLHVLSELIEYLVLGLPLPTGPG
ncbi:MAG TPA: SIS domain-containing protein [Candidatus Xenobia bacterium]|jgi:D-sedoheptulose 7-phosphate isomerase